MGFLLLILGIILSFGDFRAGPRHVQSAPIEIPPFEYCHNASYSGLPALPPNVSTFQCCPPLPERPIVDFKAPKLSPGAVNVRRPLQCADDIYLDKLEKAYQLMRALPDDDPRSLYQQSVSHCAYCGGAFVQPGTNLPIDIHYTWLFFPWHRAFLYFHERILQGLLNDTTFALPFWNWDQQLSAYPGADMEKYSPNSEDQCFKTGNKFPEQFLNSSTHNRSSLIVHRQFVPRVPGTEILDLTNFYRNYSAPYNKSEAYQVALNLNIMHRSVVKSATTPEIFFGAPYRAGSSRSVPNFDPSEIYGGSVEMGPHSGVHFWWGVEEKPEPSKSGLWNAASDPAFFAHHSNVDRLWSVWKTLGGRRKDIEDPDWLNASFLFYDENKDLVRIKISDLLDTEKLGYSFEKVDNSWISYDNSPKCSEMSLSQLASIKASLPTKLPKSGVILDHNTPYVAVVERPAEALTQEDVEETLVVGGIRLDRNVAGQFLVFLNLPDAKQNSPWNCAEFVGRFGYSPLTGGPERDISHQKFSFKTNIAAALKDLNLQSSPRVIVSVVFNPDFGYKFPKADDYPQPEQLPQISFNSIRIELS